MLTKYKTGNFNVKHKNNLMLLGLLMISGLCYSAADEKSKDQRYRASEDIKRTRMCTTSDMDIDEHQDSWTATRYLTCTMRIGTFKLNFKNKNTKSVIFYNTSNSEKKWIYIIGDTDKKNYTNEEIFAGTAAASQTFTFLMRAGATSHSTFGCHPKGNPGSISMQVNHIKGRYIAQTIITQKNRAICDIKNHFNPNIEVTYTLYRDRHNGFGDGVININ